MKKNLLGFASLSLLLATASFALMQPASSTANPAPQPAATTEAPAEALPEAKLLMDKFLAAIGGVEKLKQVKSRQVSLTLDLASANLKGRTQIYQMPPALAYTETELAQFGKIMQGSDGETVWESSLLSGTRIVKDAERAAFLRGMRFNADYDYEDAFRSMTTTGVEPVGGRPAYVVKLVTKEGTPETRLFDKESGLLVGVRTTTKSQMGEMTSDTVFSDYREVDGIKMPFKMVVKAMGVEIISTIDKAELNVPIPAERFALPEEVKALLAKQQAEQVPSPATTPAPTPVPAPDEKK